MIASAAKVLGAVSHASSIYFLIDVFVLLQSLEVKQLGVTCRTDADCAKATVLPSSCTASGLCTKKDCQEKPSNCPEGWKCNTDNFNCNKND